MRSLEKLDNPEPKLLHARQWEGGIGNMSFSPQKTPEMDLLWSVWSCQQHLHANTNLAGIFLKNSLQEERMQTGKQELRGAEV